MRSSKTDFYIYAIFRPNGTPCYIGKGRGGRWKQHIRNAHNPNLRRIYMLAGGDLPIVKLNENLTDREALAFEVAWIAALGLKRRGGVLVNLTHGGEGCSGNVLSEESRRLIGERNKGKKHPPRTAEHRARLSAAWIGRERVPNPNFAAAWGNGKTHTPETRAKMSEDRKGRPKSPEHRANMGKASIGKKMSDEARAKMRESSARRWASDGARDALIAYHAAMTEDDRSQRSRKISTAVRTAMRERGSGEKISKARAGKPLTSAQAAVLVRMAEEHRSSKHVMTEGRQRALDLAHKANTGRVQSEASRAKMRASHAKRLGRSECQQSPSTAAL